MSTSRKYAAKMKEIMAFEPPMVNVPWESWDKCEHEPDVYPAYQRYMEEFDHLGSFASSDGKTVVSQSRSARKTRQAPTETQALFQDLTKPSLHALSYVLRHPEMWPEKFNWGYQNCSSCAMGLAHKLWKDIPATKNETAPTIMARTFGIPYSTANSIFMGADPNGPQGVAPWICRTRSEEVIERERLGLFRSRPVVITQRTTGFVGYKQITPDMVADEIDRYLATVE